MRYTIMEEAIQWRKMPCFKEDCPIEKGLDRSLGSTNICNTEAVCAAQQKSTLSRTKRRHRYFAGNQKHNCSEPDCEEGQCASHQVNIECWRILANTIWAMLWSVHNVSLDVRRTILQDYCELRGECSFNSYHNEGWHLSNLDLFCCGNGKLAGRWNT